MVAHALESITRQSERVDSANIHSVITYCEWWVLKLQSIKNSREAHWENVNVCGMWKL